MNKPPKGLRALVGLGAGAVLGAVMFGLAGAIIFGCVGLILGIASEYEETLGGQASWKLMMT